MMQEYDKATRNARNKETSKKYWEELGQTDLKGIMDLFSQQSNNSLYDFNPEEKTFSNIKNARVIKYTKQVKEATAKIAKLRIIMNDLFTDQSDYKVIKEPKYTLEAETETATKPRLVMGIETPLNIMSIALQNKRESN